MKTPPTAVLDEARGELALLRGTNPALDFIPNIGQERLLHEFRGISDHEGVCGDQQSKAPYGDPKGHFPFIGVIGAGNGLGKTALMANIMVGCAFGPDEVSPWMERYGLWQKEQNWREATGMPSQYRIVCDADSMKEGGPVLQAIRDWFPKGRYKLSKEGKTFYSQVFCFDADGQVQAVFNVKTHDQGKTTHAGSNLNGIFHDEPPPEHIFGETVGRARKDGAFILFFLTPLEVAGWMIDQIIDEADLDHVVKKEIVVTYGSIWDNCKDRPGTRGHLSQVVVDRQIARWAKLSATELDARVNGKFTHLSGALYKTYNPDVHDVTDFPIPEWWPIYCIMDPHDSKAPAVIWLAQSETDAYVIKEWPAEDYVKMGSNRLTMAQIVNMAKVDIERPFARQILWRFMDPNKGRTPHRSVDTTRTVQEEYRDAGWDFELSEDDMSVGHARVQALLYYNDKLPVDESNRPYLRIFKSCTNTRVALQRYGMKKDADPGKSMTSQIDTKYKDFADVVRYFAMSKQAFKRVDEMRGFYASIFSGRVKK